MSIGIVLVILKLFKLLYGIVDISFYAKGGIFSVRNVKNRIGTHIMYLSIDT